ncbi:MAG: DUF3239 domain-containing protein [Fuerstiella sp.]
MRCKSCDAKLRIREAGPERSGSTTETARSEVLPEPSLHSPEEERKIERELRRSQESSNTAASNPGKFKASILQYSKAYPKWPMIWFGGLFASIIMCIVTPWFLIVAAFFAVSTWFYCNRLKTQFVAGCVNPGIIVSTQPPLVAVYTDLTKGGSEFPVVKIEAHPIRRMSTGAAEKGQKVTTVAFYESMEDELEHWTNFTPRLTACATSDRRVIQKQLKSIESDDWASLKDALSQVPKPLTAGLYRHYPDDALDRNFELEDDDIDGLIEGVMDGVKNCLMMSNGDRIPSEAKTYIPSDARNVVLAVVTSAQVSADDDQGIALSAFGAYYRFSEIGKGQLTWDEIAGAFLARGVLEITFTDGERLEIPTSHFLSQTKVRLEILMDTIGRGRSDM